MSVSRLNLHFVQTAQPSALCGEGVERHPGAASAAPGIRGAHRGNYTVCWARWQGAENRGGGVSPEFQPGGD